MASLSLSGKKIGHQARFFTLALLCVGILACQEPQSSEEWALKPFIKADSVNPVLLPNGESSFFCPVREDTVHWEVKDVFNPSAVVREGKVWLLYRAEDSVGRHNGTSRLGLGMSDEGREFQRWPEPVFYPAEDSVKKYEWEGGVEDPRLVEDEDGRYVLTYTAYDGETARLCVATSEDLLTWEKYGPAFGGEYRDMWSKSGAIVCKMKGSRMVATRIQGKYWMYWGDTDIFAATSEDLIHWEPFTREDGEILPLIQPRPGYFDSDLVEPGPPAILTSRGILLIYNARNAEGEKADPQLPPFTYAAGQALLDPADPVNLLDRLETNFMQPDKDYEIKGQVNRVCFIEGLVFFKGKWLLYYGTADSKIALAVCENAL